MTCASVIQYLFLMAHTRDLQVSQLSGGRGHTVPKPPTPKPPAPKPPAPLSSPPIALLPFGLFLIYPVFVRPVSLVHVAWSVDVQCDTCQLNIASGPGKIALSKSGLHALRRFTGESYKWIQYIYQVPYSSRCRYVRPPVLVLGTSPVRKIKKS